MSIRSAWRWAEKTTTVALPPPMGFTTRSGASERYATTVSQRGDVLGRDQVYTNAVGTKRRSFFGGGMRHGCAACRPAVDLGPGTPNEEAQGLLIISICPRPLINRIVEH